MKIKYGLPIMLYYEKEFGRVFVVVLMRNVAEDEKFQGKILSIH